MAPSRKRPQHSYSVIPTDLAAANYPYPLAMVSAQQCHLPSTARFGRQPQRCSRDSAGASRATHSCRLFARSHYPPRRKPYSPPESQTSGHPNKNAQRVAVCFCLPECGVPVGAARKDRQMRELATFIKSQKQSGGWPLVSLATDGDGRGEGQR